jgi:hypothetical protein
MSEQEEKPGKIDMQRYQSQRRSRSRSSGSIYAIIAFMVIGLGALLFFQQDCGDKTAHFFGMESTPAPTPKAPAK